MLDEKHLSAVPEQGYHQELILRSPPIISEKETLHLPMIVNRTNLIEAPFQIYLAMNISLSLSNKAQIARIKARADISGGSCLLDPSWEWSMQDTTSLSVENTHSLPPVLAAPRIATSPAESPLPVDKWDELAQEITKTTNGWTIHARLP